MRCRTLIDGCFSEREMVPPFDARYDLIVVGLGTAGSLAAITAGALGLRVLGLERLSGMGGTGTLGSVLDYYFGQGGGMLESINAECDALMATGRYVTSQREELNQQGRKSYSGAVKSYALERRALQAGVTLCYEASPVAVYLEGDRFAGLRYLAEGRLRDAAAPLVIDATGNAQIAYLSGCPTQTGRASDHACAYFSKTWTLYWKEDYVMGLWLANGRVNSADPGDVARANLRAMRASSRLVGAQNAGKYRAVYESPLLGVREDRRMAGREMVTLQGYLAGERTKEPLFYAASHVDTFSHDMALEDSAMQDYQYICGLFPVRITVPVPMGALIAREVEGVLVAGRCMGVDHNISGCLRMKMDMEKTGEAAAVIAWAAAQNGVPPSRAPYAQVAARLRQSGCLNDAQDQPWESNGAPLRPPETPEQMLRMLSDPASSPIALWSARQEPQRWRETLLRGLAGAPSLRRAHCALALGMQKEAAALPRLREMAGDEGSLKMAALSLFLLARYAKKEDGPLLLRILRRPLPGKGWGDGEADLRVRVFAAAEMALLGIVRAHPGCEELRRALQRIVYDDQFSAFFSIGEVDMTETLRRLALD